MEAMIKMAKSIEVVAKTIDLAIEKGLAELSLAREDVTVEVLENPKSGFLGFGASPAKILMTVLEDEPVEVKKPEKKFEKKAAPAPKEKKVVATSSNADAEEFLKNVLGFITSGATLEKREDEEGNVKLEIVGESLGGIIGGRGETLDALQHLANLVANKGSNEKVRISLDAENYRAKRSESLEKFAQRAAFQACKYKRNKVLEQMNAYERHIIHMALQDMENISTSSVGTEPNRRVVINYTGPDARPPRRRYER